MARSEARIFTSIWKDEEFRGLPPTAQRLYMFLLSQEDLTYCGVLPLRVQRWATKAAGVTVADLEQDIKALEAAGRWFVVTDTATGELLIRSFMRNDEVWKQPNLMKAARSAAAQVESEAIRAALREELRRIPAASSPSRLVRDVHYAFTCDLEEGSPNPSANPADNPSGNPDNDIPAGQEGFRKVSGKGSRKGSGKTSANPGADPSPNPSQERGEGNGLNQGDLLTPELLPTGKPEKGLANPSGNPSPNPSATAGVLVAEWIRVCRKRPPDRVIGQISAELKKLLDEDQAVDDIRAGLEQWRIAGKHPSTLASFVNGVANSGGGAAASQSAADQRVAEIERLRELDRQQREGHPNVIQGRVE